MNFTQFCRHVRHTAEVSEKHAEAMGRDCALNGPDDKNCHFSLFSNTALTRAWERGKACAALSEPQEQPNAAPQKRDVEHVGAAGPARIGVPAGAASIHSVSDGFGSTWACTLGLSKARCGLEVVRPGKVQCVKCDEEYAAPSAGVSVWRNAALAFGEELAGVGPTGYYEMQPAEWLDWALLALQSLHAQPALAAGVSEEQAEQLELLAIQIRASADHIKLCKVDGVLRYPNLQIDAGNIISAAVAMTKCAQSLRAQRAAPVAGLSANIVTDDEHGTRLVGPHGGLKKSVPNPADSDLADPLFEAIWQVTKRWDVNAPEYYIGYCGMNGSHVMLILNALRQALRAQGGVWVPREIDRAKHGHVLLVWNECMIANETLEMTWPKLVEAMLAAAGGKE